MDALRALACLAVVVFHVIGVSPEAGLLVADGPLRATASLLDLFHMPMFAMLSGVAYALSPVRPGRAARFVRRRFARIVLPLVTVTTLFLVAQHLVPGTNTLPPDSWWAAYLMPYAHFWYLQSLIWLLAVVGLIEWLFGGRPTVTALLFVGAIAAYFGRGWVPDVFSMSGAAGLAPFFVVGMVATRTGGGRPAFALIALALGLAAGALTTALGFPETRDGQGLALATGTGVCAGLLLSGLVAGTRGRWLHGLGAASYTIYLYHVFGTAGARMALYAAGVTDHGVHLALGTAAGVALPWALDAALRQHRGRLGFAPLFLAGHMPPRRGVPLTEADAASAPARAATSA